MTGLIEMMLLRAMTASAAHEESRRRKRQKKADGQARGRVYLPGLQEEGGGKGCLKKN